MQIDIALQKGGFEIAVDFQIRGIYGVDNWDNVFEWLNSETEKPNEEQVLEWWNQYTSEKNAILQEKTEQYMLLTSWGERASFLLKDAQYFKDTSDIIWEAIEAGKPEVSGEEIDSLHSSFQSAIELNSFWADSHNYVLEFLDIAINPQNPLNETHGRKAFEIIGWYLFNAIAANVTAQALQLNLSKK